jgi:uncharacterized membrane protein
VTDGVVTVGASSVSLNSSGIAFFSDLVAARVYHMSVVVNGVTVYDNNVFVVPASGVFTVNLAVKSSPGISWVLLAGLVLIAVVIIIAIILVTFMLRKRTKH